MDKKRSKVVVAEFKKTVIPDWENIPRDRAVKLATENESDAKEIIKLANEIQKHMHYEYKNANF